MSKPMPFPTECCGTCRHRARVEPDFRRCEVCHHLCPVRNEDPAAWAAALTFTCPACHRVSYNHNDARERYCGVCHQFFPAEKGGGR